MTLTRRVFAVLMLIVLPAAAFAQTPAVTAPKTGATANPEVILTFAPVMEKVKGKWVEVDHQTVRLGDVVVVRIDHDDVFRKNAGTKPITLFLNGQDTTLPPIDQAGRDFVFRLERNDANKELWSRLLEAPFTQPVSKVHVSAGYDGLGPLPARGAAGLMKLRKMEWGFAAWVWIFILILVLSYFRHLVKSTDILRNGPAINKQDQAFSLGRSQMAWWLFIVIVSYVTIWMITGNRDTVSNSTLILIGISGATALGAVAIDATSSTRVKTALDRLTTEETTLRTQLAAVPVTVPPAAGVPPDPAAARAKQLTDALNDRLAAIQQEKVNLVTAPPSVGWLTDVLTDDNGAVALHRLQVLLWTFVLGVVFLASVLHVLSMPEFNTTLLALMGISAGTYLGFKMPSNS
jgi:hypothetical protein